MREEGVVAVDVESIHVRVTQGTYSVVCSPPGAKKEPATVAVALFSLPYCVAAALVHREFKLSQMTLEAIHDPAVRALTQCVSTTVDSELEARHGAGVGPSIVEVTLKNGHRLTRRVDYCKGHPKNLMSFDDCAEKFRLCAASAVNPLPGQSVEEVVAQVKNLDRLDNVIQVVSLLA